VRVVDHVVQALQLVVAGARDGGDARLGTRIEIAVEQVGRAQ
jgi:hypothetical protein